MISLEDASFAMAQISAYFAIQARNNADDVSAELFQKAEAIEDMLKAQEPCEDAVSRYYLLSHSYCTKPATYDDIYGGPCVVDVDVIENAPAVTPKAQEPRLLSVEEMHNLNPGDMVWVETWYLDDATQTPKTHLEMGVVIPTREIYFEGTWDYLDRIKAVNNEDFKERYWSAKPTDEQRWEVKWDDL